MATIVSNPYYDLAAVRSPDMFYGRARLLRSLFATIVNRQSISLVGPRGIGKSSVLRHIVVPAVQGQSGHDFSRYVLVLIDLRDYLNKSSETFFEAVSRHIAAQCQGRVQLQIQERSADEEFQQILEQITEQGFHTVLLMDGFDSITRNKKFDPEFFSFLRACATAGRVSYVTASRAPLYEVCHHAIKESPFFNIFSTRYLEPLTRDEARDLVMIPSERAGYGFSETEMQWVLEMAGRHPFFIQRVCHILFEEKSAWDDERAPAEDTTDREDTINPQGVTCGPRSLRDVQRMVHAELRPHFEHMWERLDEKEQQHLKDSVRGVGQSKMPELSESALFCQFVREKCDIQLFEMSVEELEGVLDKIDDIRVLGESELRHLQVVAQRLLMVGASSPIECGRAVREVLNAAHECLRGNGIRSDTALEWRLYNILYYRYFKRHLKNEAISVKLEFTSIRQYYRERNKAIESLLNALLGMEVGVK
ncbi:MAG TPA: ATP-binding protein [Ktedonosporobacter sp.]|nr:ATP-binding protein [Ktedonosporobacter sp.]